MAITTSGQWQNITQKDLSLVFMDRLHGFPSMLPYLYRFKQAEQGTEYDLEVGDIQSPQVFNGQVQYPVIGQGYEKYVQETQYALGFLVTRQLLRNDLYGAVRDSAAGLADSFRLLRESQGAFPFVNSFNGAFTTGDGLSLCNAAHTSNNGGPNFSNTNTLAFSAPNLQANRILMKKMPSNTGQVITNIPDTILVPMDLEDSVFTVLKALGQVGSGNNDLNYSQGRYKVIVWDNFLTSSTNWWIMNSSLMKQRLVWREWEKTTFMRSGDVDTLATKYVGYTSFGLSTVEPRWIFGSPS